MQRSIYREALKQSGGVIIEQLSTCIRSTGMVLLFGAVFALFICSVTAQGSAEKDLKKFYQENCARCHGADGSAVSEDGKRLRGQDFTDQEWQNSTTDERMVRTILRGKFLGLAMPGFRDALTEDEAREMVTDIIRRSRKGEVIAPDDERPNGI